MHRSRHDAELLPLFMFVDHFTVPDGTDNLKHGTDGSMKILGPCNKKAEGNEGDMTEKEISWHLFHGPDATKVMHACIHACMHPCIHPSMHPCILACKRGDVNICLHGACNNPKQTLLLPLIMTRCIGLPRPFKYCTLSPQPSQSQPACRKNTPHRPS